MVLLTPASSYTTGRFYRKRLLLEGKFQIMTHSDHPVAPMAAPIHGRWRPMEARDLPAVSALAERLHPACPERPAILEERHSLCPPGCLILPGPTGGVGGYVLSHPWRMASPPALDTYLRRLPEAADCWYCMTSPSCPPCAGGAIRMRHSGSWRRRPGGRAYHGLPLWRPRARGRSGRIWASRPWPTYRHRSRGVMARMPARCAAPFPLPPDPGKDYAGRLARSPRARMERRAAMTAASSAVVSMSRQPSNADSARPADRSSARASASSSASSVGSMGV